MSLINQVLNDLEKRGAGALPGEPAIRPVSAPRDRRNMLVPVAALLVLLLITAGWWWSSPRHVAAPAAKEGPRSTSSTVITPSAPAIVPESQPAAAIAATETPRAATPPKVGAPSLLLSFELSSIPLPSSLRAKPAPPVTEAPVINGVSPNPLLATGSAQLLMINGSHFASGAKVTLRTGGKEYANRPISSLSPSQIALYPNFGKASDTWTVEVFNPGGNSSGPYTFTVQSPLPAASATNPDRIVPPTSAKPAVPAISAGSVDKQIKQVSVQQQADNEFRKANGLMQQGRINEAISGYATALRLDAGHEAARQAVVGLMLESKRNNDAERILQEGLKHNPKHSGFAMLLARLQVERNELAPALEILRATLPYAGQQADYRAFIAAVLQRLGQHKEAISHYQAALQLSPNSGVWLMGMGISLQAEQRKDEARDAFKRALESHGLNAELQAFVTQRLKGL